LQKGGRHVRSGFPESHGLAEGLSRLQGSHGRSRTRLADRGPGAARLLHRQCGGRPRRVLRNAGLRPIHGCLAAIKANLAAGLPAEFGFTVYSSIRQADARGAIPFPAPGKDIEGGHAIDAVGYDDSIKIKNGNKGGIETTGAFLIRNSWGAGWGDKGYGWLPYEYLLKGLAVDWWSILKNEWVSTKQFGLS
jgi:hypothetical protein